MNVLLVDNGTTLQEKLKQLIPGEESVLCFDAFSEKNTEDADVVVLSGSSLGPLYGNEEKYKAEIEFIQNTTKPIIGICFGYELIIHALGGVLKKLDEHEIGTVQIHVLKDLELFYRTPTFQAFENHRWGTGELPAEFEVLAESDHGPEVIRHKTRPIYALQFHPENHTDTSFGDELFLNIFNRLKNL
ncbi:MAG: type 1 glutamine amidotransferase [Patescibacteria group bacterium UBA2163]